MFITPKVPLMKRTSIIIFGIIIYLILDIIYIQYMIHAEWATESAQNSVDVLFQSLKLLLPLLLWIVANPTFVKPHAE
jgi:hypothetical protein